ncbi:MAG: hypothetical protein GF350_06970, partial [Chitinivibrionales bacterium]|nr:hypothetical protein [Chitinivibrionales bacterium]
MTSKVAIFTVAVFLAAGTIPGQDTISENSCFTRQGRIADPSATRPDASWEPGYQQRVDSLIHAQTWTPGNGESSQDAGKSDWSLLLAEMAKDLGDDPALQNWIDTKGDELLNSKWAGSFFKAFSCPGYAMYYFKYKDKLPQSQHNRVYSQLYDQRTYDNSVFMDGQSTDEQVTVTGWECLMRPDHHMDPIYGYTEFNSENYNWMARLTGYLFAHEYADNTYVNYYDPYYKNWTRAAFCAGRVEWDSNNYGGYCIQSALNAYEFAPTPEDRRRAQAVLDWLMITTALHHIDGFCVGADVRAKYNAYRPFAGTLVPYSYVYFADAIQPSYDIDSLQEHMRI